MPGYLVVTSYVVVNSVYLTATTGYFWFLVFLTIPSNLIL